MYEMQIDLLSSVIFAQIIYVFVIMEIQLSGQANGFTFSSQESSSSIHSTLIHVLFGFQFDLAPALHCAARKRVKKGSNTLKFKPAAKNTTFAFSSVLELKNKLLFMMIKYRLYPNFKLLF